MKAEEALRQKLDLMEDRQRAKKIQEKAKHLSPSEVMLLMMLGAI